MGNFRRERILFRGGATVTAAGAAAGVAESVDVCLEDAGELAPSSPLPRREAAPVTASSFVAAVDAVVTLVEEADAAAAAPMSAGLVGVGLDACSSWPGSPSPSWSLLLVAVVVVVVVVVAVGAEAAAATTSEGLGAAAGEGEGDDDDDNDGDKDGVRLLCIPGCEAGGIGTRESLTR